MSEFEKEIFLLIEKIIEILYDNTYKLGIYSHSIFSDSDNILPFSNHSWDINCDLRNKLSSLLNKSVEINMKFTDINIRSYKHYTKLTKDVLRIHNQIIENADNINLLCKKIFKCAKKEYDYNFGEELKYYYFNSICNDSIYNYFNDLMPICHKIAKELNHNLIILEYFDYIYYVFTKDYSDFIFPYLDKIIKQYI